MRRVGAAWQRQKAPGQRERAWVIARKRICASTAAHETKNTRRCAAALPLPPRPSPHPLPTRLMAHGVLRLRRAPSTLNVARARGRTYPSPFPLSLPLHHYSI